MSVIDRAVALGADPKSFLRGGANHGLAKLRAKLGAEAVEQAVAMAVFRSESLLAFAPPNGGRLSKAVAAELTALGMQAGVPDVLVIGGERHRSVALEFKRPNLQPKRPDADPLERAHVADPQRVWLLALRGAGWRAEVVYSAEQAIEVLRDEGILPTRNSIIVNMRPAAGPADRRRVLAELQRRGDNA